MGQQESQQPDSLINTSLWLVILYLPTFLLSIIFGLYAHQNNIADPQAWFADGDVICLFTLLMALFTLPIVAVATQNKANRSEYLALSRPFSITEFRPWFLITGGFIATWWLINSLLGVETPQSMQLIYETTDYVLLSLLAICVVAPLFEEVVFRGFLFSRFRHTYLGQSGALLFTSVIFTMIHGQYQGIELLMIFSLAVLLGVCRIKTGNVKNCIAIHMLNNAVAMFVLYV